MLCSNLFRFARNYSSSAKQTLAVRERLANKRHQALLGGGQKRIEAQHKKVN